MFSIRTALEDDSFLWPSIPEPAFLCCDESGCGDGLVAVG